MEYKSNTNICTQCFKYLMEDIVEFILNKEKNECEDVLHLMCQKIDPVDKKCIIHYVRDCVEY